MLSSSCGLPVLPNLPILQLRLIRQLTLVFRKPTSTSRPLLEMAVVGDDHIGVVLIGRNKLLVGRRYMVGVAVEHIGQVVAPLVAVADDAAVQLHMLLGIDVTP